jgi:hypothetical protein
VDAVGVQEAAMTDTTQVIRDPVTGAVIMRITHRPGVGLTIVDLECEEAKFFAPKLMPQPSYKVCRRGNKPDRWVYRQEVWQGVS